MSERNPKPLSEDLIIRPYLPRDLVDVGRIFESLDRESKFDSYARSYVCCYMGMPVGVILPEVVGNYLHVKELCTLRRFQKQGVASTLIRYVKDKSVEFNGIKSVVIQIPLNLENSEAIKFIKKRFEFLRKTEDDTMIFIDHVSKFQGVAGWLC